VNYSHHDKQYIGQIQTRSQLNQLPTYLSKTIDFILSYLEQSLSSFLKSIYDGKFTSPFFNLRKHCLFPFILVIAKLP